MTVFDTEILRADRRPMLSTLWIFVLLNVLFHDLHELFRSGLLEQMISGTVNGTRITEELILAGGVFIEVPLLMILMSRALRPAISRIANVAAAITAIPLILSSGIRDLDDGFFATVNVTALLCITWFAWSWRCSKTASTQRAAETADLLISDGRNARA